MNIEFLPGLTNVVRFPVEERVRPSIELVWEIEPDVREVLNVAEAFHMDGDVDLHLKDATDRETATYIAEQVLPAAPSELKARLDALLRPVLERAVDACRAAHGIAVKAMEAQTKAHAAKVEGGYWLAPLEERATELTEHAARLLIEAHNRCQEARGAYRATSLAQRGETWQPYDPRAETDAWLADAEAVRVRRAPEAVT